MENSASIPRGNPRIPVGILKRVGDPIFGGHRPSSHQGIPGGSGISNSSDPAIPFQLTGAAIIAFSSVATLEICSRVNSANMGRDTNSEAFFSATGKDPLPRFRDL